MPSCNPPTPIEDIDMLFYKGMSDIFQIKSARVSFIEKNGGKDCSIDQGNETLFFGDFIIYPNADVHRGNSYYRKSWSDFDIISNTLNCSKHENTSKC